MSQKQLLKKKKPHSQIIAISAKESHASKKESSQLTTELHNVTSQADWAQNRAEFYWKNAKKYETMGWMEMALEAKTESEMQSQIARQLKKKIIYIQEKLARLHKVYLVGFQQGENYATMKVEEPPSDNEE